MSAKMMQFVSVPPAMPDKRAVPDRSADFAEIYGRFAPERAVEQASRCEQCGCVSRPCAATSRRGTRISRGCARRCASAAARPAVPPCA